MRSRFIKPVSYTHLDVYKRQSLHNASALREIAVPDAFALVFGNEGKGVSEEVLRLADTHVFIEMHTFESLNVAVAAGICMYAFKK